MSELGFDPLNDGSLVFPHYTTSNGCSRSLKAITHIKDVGKRWEEYKRICIRFGYTEGFLSIGNFSYAIHYSNR